MVHPLSSDVKLPNAMFGISIMFSEPSAAKTSPYPCSDRCWLLAYRSAHSRGDLNRYYRNWPTDLVIDAFFEKQDWNETGELAFKKQLYFSQLGQALVQVRQIHEWRVTNMFGKCD